MFPAWGDDTWPQSPKTKGGLDPSCRRVRDGEDFDKALLCIVARDTGCCRRIQACAGPGPEVDGEGSELRDEAPGSVFCLWRHSRTVWLWRQKEIVFQNSSGASPSQATVLSLLSCLERRHW